LEFAGPEKVSHQNTLLTFPRLRAKVFHRIRAISNTKTAGAVSDWKNWKKKVRAADAKEVGVGNPAEETCCSPEHQYLRADAK
jgi:hypothetical protein